MLVLYDHVQDPEAVKLDSAGSPDAGQTEPARLAQTTASQLLFLVESSDVLDSRPGLLA